MALFGSLEYMLFIIIMKLLLLLLLLIIITIINIEDTVKIMMII